jgi:hypothetical protein
MRRAASGMLAAAVVMVAVWTGCGSSFSSAGGDDGGVRDATSSSSGSGGSSGSSGGQGDASGSGSGSSSSSGSSSGGGKDDGGRGDGGGDGGIGTSDAGCGGATSIRCAGQQPQKCADGAWVNNGYPCVDQTCIGGVCTGVCAPSQTACADAGAQETCTTSGQWGAATSCGFEQPCCNGACDLNDPKNCGSCGTTCGATNNCGNGVCAPPGTCGLCAEDVQCEAYCSPKTGYVYCCASGTCTATAGASCPL